MTVIINDPAAGGSELQYVPLDSSAGFFGAIGDSNIANGVSIGGTGPAYTTYEHQRNHIKIFQALNNYPFQIPVFHRGGTVPYGTIAGIGGEFTRQVAARLQANLLQQRLHTLLIEAGTNDLKNDYTAENVFSNISLMIRMAMMADIKEIWLCGVLPRNNDGGVDFSAGQETERLKYNNYLRELCARNTGFLRYLNPDPIFLDSATGKLRQDASYDGLHRNTYGNYLYAKYVMTPAWLSAGRDRTFKRIITPAYNASTNPYGNLLTNGAFTGTAGTISTGGAGTLPDSWRAERSAGTQASYVASIVSEANDAGETVNKIKLVLSSNGTTADTETIRFRPTADITTGITAGKWYQVEYEIDLVATSGSDILRSFYTAVTDLTTGGQEARFFSSRYASDTFLNVNDTLIVRTQPVYVRGTTGVRFYTYFDINGTVSGSREIKISNPVLREVPNPFPQYDDRNQTKLLFCLKGADMQSTSDQILERRFRGTNYIVTDVRGVRASGGTTVACAGGIYTAASKGGTALVAAAQSWVSLSGAGKAVKATLAAAADTDTQSADLYLSLTTGSTAAATADIYVYGYCTD